ncbi:MAG TPA: GNAT family N-acetyltransferase [Bacillota bacterium]|nr:GNAT family N-acetyltransferase [Bacillota bacterium]HPZ89785.1 GNAT family N-acetyltransferase [Bacillota bacterium]HQE01199.1 GNAT family N-acetyltransferase [Bacillota bacterium]
MEIVRATADRAEDIGYVHAMSWHAAYHGLVPQELLDNFTPEKRAEMFRTTIPASAEEYYIAYLDRQPVGMLALGNSQDDDADASVGEIHAIYVLAEYWGRGYGKKLMDFAVNRLRELSCRTVTLWVMAENTRARRFYEIYGYVWDGATREINLGGKPFVLVRYVFALE